MGIAFKDDARDPELPFQPIRDRDSGRSPQLPPPAVLTPPRPSLAMPSSVAAGKIQMQSRQENSYRSNSIVPTPVTPLWPDTPTRHPYQAIAASSRSPRTQLANPQPGTMVIPVTAQSTPLSPAIDRSRGIQPLVWLHRGVGVMTVALVATALGFYGQSVYYQRQWGQHYQQLQRLKTLEHQGITANEVMKHTLIEQSAAPEVNMQMPVPGTAIPVPKAPLRSPRAVEQPVPIQDLELNAPTGY